MLRADDKLLGVRKEFYDRCRRIVVSDSIQEKVTEAHRLTKCPYLTYVQAEADRQPVELMQPSPMGRYPYDLRPTVAVPKQPGRPIHFQIVKSHEMKKRASLKSTEGLRQLIHALAHIELTACEIDAAMILEFPQAPLGWVRDWVAILNDEQRHFLLLASLLKDLNTVYGDLPVHFGLWDSAFLGKTWLEQIAIVCRYQEAGGVDASHYAGVQLREAGRDATASIIDRIHNDEIRHVTYGNRWWMWAFSHYRLVARENIPLGEEMGKHFFKIIDERLPTAWKTRVPLDREGRRKCGFSPFEIHGMDSRVKT